MAVQNKKKNNKLIWILVGVVAVLLVAAVWINKGKKEGEKVYAEKVGKRTIQETVSASGRIFPEKEIKVSSDVSGEIVDLMVKEGDSVHAGQLLCRVDARIYRDQVTRGQASVSASRAQYANALSNIESVRARQLQIIAQKEQLQAQLVQTQQSFKRNDQLHRDGVISDSDFETTQSQLRQQEANIKAADAQIQASLNDIASSQKSAEAAQYNVKSTEASLKGGGFTPLSFAASEIRWSDHQPGDALATINVTTSNPANPGGFTFPMEFRPHNGGWQLSRETADMLLAFGNARTEAGPTASPASPR